MLGRPKQISKNRSRSAGAGLLRRIRSISLGSFQKKKMKKIKVISFDLDNTIWDNSPVIHNATKAERIHLKKHFPEVFTFLEENKKGMVGFRKKVIELHPDKDHDLNFIRKTSFKLLGESLNLQEEEVRNLVDSSFEIFDKERQNVLEHVYPGVIEALKKLKMNGFKLIALTNGTAETQRIEHLKDIFDHHISAFSAGALKPHHAPFTKLIELAEVDKEEILHVGDNIIDDVKGSVEFGLKVVWIHDKLPDIKLGAHKNVFMEHSLSEEFHVASIPSVAKIFDVLAHLGQPCEASL